jgi:hypothetical protein
MSDNERKEESALDKLSKLETHCRDCNGCGTSGRFGERCVLCGGSGYETTEFGEKVLALMRHHFRPLFRELINGE